jgi:DNA replication initiation complex subunit (GINS family)
MRKSLRAFFGPDNYLNTTLEKAIDTVAELVPGMKDPDAAEKPTTQPSSQTTATIAFRNGFGFTPDEEDLYTALHNSIDPYFVTVTSTVQNRIDGARNEVTENAKLAAWLASEKKEEATAATEAALATMSTMSPTTMTELVTKHSTDVSEKVATKTTQRLIKKQMRKNSSGG